MRSDVVAQPNILLFFPDQHRPDWLPHNPDVPLRMPHLQALMAQGVHFPHAVTPSPLCAPARACLASGRDYDHCGVPSNQADYPLDQETMYQRLRQAGYHVGGVGKFDLHKATHSWGLDGKRLLSQWGFTHGIDNEGKLDAVASGAAEPAGPYMRLLHAHDLATAHVEDFHRRSGGLRSYTATHPTPLPEAAYCDNWIADNAVNVLEEMPTGHPWYLQVNFTGPHDPMDVTTEMQRNWAGIDFPLPVDNTQVDTDTHQQIRRHYAAMLENIDRHIGRLLTHVEQRGELHRTLVVYASDHGEMLGDHNLWLKSTFYQPSIGTPLVVAGPGVQTGVTSDALVALQDLTATFLDSAAAKPLTQMDGRSLWSCLRGQAATHRSHVHSALGDWRAVYDGRYKLVTTDGSTCQLFDHDTDPWERNDIADTHPVAVARLTGLLGRSPWELSTPASPPQRPLNSFTTAQTETEKPQ